MCAGAISLARVPRLVYGTSDPKGGAAGGVIDLYAPPASAALESPSRWSSAGCSPLRPAALLEAFFADRR